MHLCCVSCPCLLHASWLQGHKHGKQKKAKKDKKEKKEKKDKHKRRERWGSPCVWRQHVVSLPCYTHA